MKHRLTPVVKKVMSVLGKHGFFVVKMEGDHIKVNKNPPLRRPIILVNVKRLSNKVRQNLLSEAEEAGVSRQEFSKIFKNL
jgi:predicted RNA binding protein YcfA (HicA-like mRNA interferase family)